jgi:hypothetical protein
MPTMDSVDFDALYCMFKGEPGTRKSTQALSFPTPQEWFSWDRKMNGIVLPMRKWGIDPKLINYTDYDDWNKPRARLEQLQVKCDARTLIFDSVTSCADMTLRQTMKAKYGQSRKSGATAGKMVAGIAVNEIEDYNAESSALNELIALTKDINAFHKVNIIKKGFVEGQGGDYSLLTEHTGDDFARTALGLDREIVFGDKPLYDTWIKPAIAKIQQPATPTTKF